MASFYITKSVHFILMKKNYQRNNFLEFVHYGVLGTRGRDMEWWYVYVLLEN
jgi:hypothetical protein